MGGDSAQDWFIRWLMGFYGSNEVTVSLSIDVPDLVT